MSWYAIHTRPNFEAAVDRLLRLRGYETFYPYERVKRWRNLPNGRGRRQVESELPYLSRYTFVNCDRDDVGLVNRVTGVSTVVHIEGEPIPIPEPIMRVFIDASVDDGLMGVDDRVRRSKAFRGKVGDRFRFSMASPFAEFIGEIASLRGLDAKGEITVWLTMFGARKRVLASIEHIGEILAAA